MSCLPTAFCDFSRLAAARHPGEHMQTVLRDLGATHKLIRPHGLWQNGKVERVNRTLQTEWAYRQVFTSNTARANALSPWIEYHTTERHHSAINATHQPSVTNRTAEYI